MAPVLTPEPVAAGELLLRPWQASDAPVVAAALLDPDLRLWAPIPLVAGEEVESARQWCEQRADWSDATHASWAITLAEGGDVVGGIALHQLDFEHLNGEAGYMVFAPWRRRGIASTALDAASAFGFGRLGLVRLELFHGVENVASCTVANRSGYLLEGTHRKSFVYGDGKWHDEHCHARLASDPPPDRP